MASTIRVGDALRGLGLLLLLLGAAPGAALGQDNRAQAKRHFERALVLLEEEAYREAVVELERAYVLSPHFSVLYNLGMAQVALGKPVEAVDALGRFLREGGDQVDADKRAAVQAEISRQADRVAHLRLRVEPPDSVVTIDERPVQLSPQGLALGIGEHVVRVTREGHVEQSRRIVLAGKESLGLEIVLMRKPEPTSSTQAVGQLAVRCDVPGVDVLIDGSKVAVTPLREPLLVPEGERELRFARLGYAGSARLLRIAAGERLASDCALRVAPNAAPSLLGTLAVQVSEPDARIVVDGTALPARGLLPEGPHQLRVERSGFEPVTRLVEVEGGAQRTARVALIPTPEYRAGYESTAGTHRTLAWVLTVGGVVLGGATAGIIYWNDRRFLEWQTEEYALAEMARQGVPNLESRYATHDANLKVIETVDSVSIGLGIAAGASLVAGVVFWIIGDDPDRYEGLGASVDPVARRVTLQQRF